MFAITYFSTIIILLLLLMSSVMESRVEYTFKRYTYRKKRDDKKYRVARQQCEMSSHCQGVLGVLNARCVRMCVSTTCYEELYGQDELEEGEIDVRLNSFKGCLSQVAILYI